MRLFSYYALHSIKNQIKKLFKTWVLIFLVACIAMGGLVGLFAASMSDKKAELSGETQAETAEEEPGAISVFMQESGVSNNDMFELVAGIVVLGMFVLFGMSADKSGGKMFLPADINLLFASPMKPQSVLMFRVASRLGMVVFASLYLLFELPSLIHVFGMSFWAALFLILSWGLTFLTATLIQISLYIASSAFPKVKENLRRVILALLLLITVGYILTLGRSGENSLKAAVLFFNGPGSRWIPLWGWIKGTCVFALEGNLAKAVLCLLLSLAGAGLLFFIVWRLKADFYEDAMAKSEEVAALVEKAQSEKPNTFIISEKKKTDRSDRLLRNGMKHGWGANVFFFKTMYNRFRFAHLHLFTKTTELYLVAAAAAAAICRFGPGTSSVIPMALTLAGLSFFRSLGNPLEQDTKMDYFVMIPENTWSKMFWSLMGGTTDCLLDVIPAILVGTAILGGNLLSALAWIPFIISVDFYATNVGAFINLSVPVSAGNTVKQIVQIMFIYFGLLPDIVLIVLGFVFGHTTMAAIAAAVVNLALGFLFFGLSPIFLDPYGGKIRANESASQVNLSTAKRSFSRLGLGIFVSILLAEVVAIVLTTLLPNWQSNRWLIFLCGVAPLQLIGLPVGYLLMRKVPAQTSASRKISLDKMVILAIICSFMSYAGSLLSELITVLLQRIFLISTVNPVETFVVEGGLLPNILFMVILAPLVEEFIFRKALIDRIRPYGERLAVITSALLFGLYHRNFSQLFYTFGLGLVFGYVYLKTSKLRYSVGLHMLVNLMGAVVAPLIINNLDLNALQTPGLTDTAKLEIMLSPQMIAYALYNFSTVVLALAGLVLFIIHVRNIRFAPAQLELPRKTRFKTVYLNIGMLLLILLCFAEIALTVLL